MNKPDNSIDWDFLYYFARVELGFSEDEFWKLTMRKYGSLLHQREIFSNSPEKEDKNELNEEGNFF